MRGYCRPISASLHVCKTEQSVGRTNMETLISRDVSGEISSLRLHVLEEYSSQDGAYVAQCLETGAVATGETPEETHALIRLVLQSDILLAMESGSLENLFRVRADPAAWDRWYQANGGGTCEVEDLEIVPPALEKRGVQSQLSIAKVSKYSVA